MHLGLTGNFTGGQHRKLYCVLCLKLHRFGLDSVLEKSCIATGGRFGAPILNQCALKHSIHILSVWACSESLKTLVVSSSGRRILGFDLEILVVDWRRGGAERYCAIAQRDEGVWASYCLQHLALAIKLVDICCVLVTDPIGIIIPKHKTFSVEWDAGTSCSVISEAITSV